MKFCILLAAIAGPAGIGEQIHAQEAAPPPPEVQVLTRGPVHEAFSSLVNYNPEPGLIVPKVPPENIAEIPPEEKPAGENVTWIPGYWAWDEEREDFLWVSGVWRSLPPGREWVPGYWRDVETSSQWVSGYWRNVAGTETTYLPPPPRTLEVGPNINAPGPEYIWSPGCWVWRGNQYAWQPGYWYPGRNDWVWVPATYVWTPGGYVYVEGYWDYPVARRGVLFAPVYYPSRSYIARNYSYSPQVVIDLFLLVDHLFLRPRYHHYYFGDYYDKGYRSGGYYAPFDFDSGYHGYDCLYSYERWTRRGDSGWDDFYRSSYRKRYDDENERPFRLWSEARQDRGGPRDKRKAIGEFYDEYAKRGNAVGGYKKVEQEERRMIELREKELRELRQERGETEGRIAREDPWKDGNKKEPFKIKSSKSPLAGDLSKFPGGEPPPPKATDDGRPSRKDRDEDKKDASSGQKARRDEAGDGGKGKVDKPREKPDKPSGEEKKNPKKDNDRDSKPRAEKDRKSDSGKSSPEKSGKERGKKTDSKEKGKKDR